MTDKRNIIIIKPKSDHQKINDYRIDIFPVFMKDQLLADTGTHYMKKIHGKKSKGYLGQCEHVPDFDDNYEIKIDWINKGSINLLFCDGTTKEIYTDKINLILKGLFVEKGKTSTNIPKGTNVYLYKSSTYIYAILITSIEVNDINDSSEPNIVLNVGNIGYYYNTDDMLYQVAIKRAITKFLNLKKIYIKPSIKKVAIFSHNSCYWNMGGKRK